MRATAVMAGCAVLAGCFTLSPVRLDSDLQPGRVRVHLSDAGAARVAGTLGGDTTSVVNGELSSATADEIVVRVPSAGGAGFEGKVLYQELRLPKREITGLERRELNRMRTRLTIGGVAAVAGVLLYTSLSGKTGGTPDGGNGGPVESRVPILRLWFW